MLTHMSNVFCNIHQELLKCVCKIMGFLNGKSVEILFIY